MNSWKQRLLKLATLTPWWPIWTLIWWDKLPKWWKIWTQPRWRKCRKWLPKWWVAGVCQEECPGVWVCLEACQTINSLPSKRQLISNLPLPKLIHLWVRPNWQTCRKQRSLRRRLTRFLKAKSWKRRVESTLKLFRPSVWMRLWEAKSRRLTSKWPAEVTWPCANSIWKIITRSLTTAKKCLTTTQTT